jgi:lipoate-protein ligase A
VPWAKTINNVICVAKERITSIKHELNREISQKEAYQALIKGFQKAFKTEFSDETLTAYERNLASELRRKKYTTKKWNFESGTPSQ